MGAGIPVTRQVPVALCLQMLLDSSFSTFGWIFFGFGFLIALAVVTRCELFTSWQFIGTLSSTTGVIDSIRDSGAHENDQQIYVVDYSYSPPGSGQLRGIAYFVGVNHEPGEKVTVQYRAGHPQYSRIPGMRTAELPMLALLVLLFPAIGLTLMLVKISQGLRGIKLLQFGLPALGTLIAVERTNYSINDAPVFRMIFQFIAADGLQYTVKYLSTDLKPAWWQFYQQANPQQINQRVAENVKKVVAKVQWLLPSNIKDALANNNSEQHANTSPDPAELQEMLLYLPTNPTRAALPLAFAKGINMDAMGNLHGVHPIRGILVSIIPLLVTLTIAVFGYFVLPH